MAHTQTQESPARSGSTPRFRTGVVARCEETHKTGVAFTVTSEPNVPTPAGRSLICTTCGHPVSGGHPSSCNSPTQRFVTPEEWAHLRPVPAALPRVSREEFRRLREVARRSQRPSNSDPELI